jgi:hypothetical protein
VGNINWGGELLGMSNRLLWRNSGNKVLPSSFFQTNMHLSYSFTFSLCVFIYLIYLFIYLFCGVSFQPMVLHIHKFSSTELHSQSCLSILIPCSFHIQFFPQCILLHSWMLYILVYPNSLSRVFHYLINILIWSIPYSSWR